MAGRKRPREDGGDDGGGPSSDHDERVMDTRQVLGESLNMNVTREDREFPLSLLAHDDDDGEQHQSKEHDQVEGGTSEVVEEEDDEADEADMYDQSHVGHEHVDHLQAQEHGDMQLHASDDRRADPHLSLHGYQFGDLDTSSYVLDVPSSYTALPASPPDTSEGIAPPPPSGEHTMQLPDGRLVRWTRAKRPGPGLRLSAAEHELVLHVYDYFRGNAASSQNHVLKQTSDALRIGKGKIRALVTDRDRLVACGAPKDCVPLPEGESRRGTGPLLGGEHRRFLKAHVGAHGPPESLEALAAVLARLPERGQRMAQYGMMISPGAIVLQDDQLKSIFKKWRRKQIDSQL